LVIVIYENYYYYYTSPLTSTATPTTTDIYTLHQYLLMTSILSLVAKLRAIQTVIK